MRKKSVLGRVAVIAMALTLATTSMMSGTLARYEMVKTQEASAIVAKWSPTIQTNEAHVTTGTIDLAKTMTLGSLQDIKGGEIGNSSAGDVIAPGTNGSTTFTVNVTGAEVPTLCTIAITAVDDGSGKPDTGYVFPPHLTLTVKDGNTTLATIKPDGYSNAGGQLTYNDPLGYGTQTKKQVVLVGKTDAGAQETEKPIRFPAKKDASTGNATQSKTYTLEWNWPYADATSADSSYNDFDTKVAQDAASGDLKFGFDLVINLHQQAKGETVFQDATKAS